ncbi:accessory Sec system translocase SecA2 [Actinocrispum sp. NPDC049592]|uniref:accessory Sec system translocase SecA2 n=1 Tax=Actinocrispum sp. NPDC049592 TaxID=3154835 RepID=UPI0034267759
MLTRVRNRLRRLMERPASVELTKYEALLPKIEDRESDIAKLSDEELTAKVGKLRADRDFGDDELVEYCALAREAAKRALNERPYDVQLLGVMGMLAGHVVQMATGEGKTLAGALAAGGFAVRGKQVHVISVNDYLAKRDAEWMQPVYDLLGVTVGYVGERITAEHRRAAYEAEVCYGSVSEIGFDLLRDRLATDPAQEVQRPHNVQVALIDEADSVLVDEAKVPLVMAGTAEGVERDADMAEIVRRLRSGIHYEEDEDGRNAWLTPSGAKAVEKALGGVDLYAEDSPYLAAVNVALHAHALLERDVDYIVRDNKVQLINTARGRIAALQRWPDGLQAAVEAKEAVAATESGEVLDNITVQALIARYPKVAGMTGTAVAVAEQLREFYKLEVAVIAPNKPCVREDELIRLYTTEEAKEDALISEIIDAHEKGRPILVGTLDVAESERIAKRLGEKGLQSVVLNAKNDAEEAAIVAEAGAYGAITVSTQMAGRGTDIRLGGHDESDHDKVAELGGLYVIGTGHYPSSRLDDQLRGRAGRQGDPGGSVFFSSLEDEQLIQYAPEVQLHVLKEPPGEDGLVKDKTARAFVVHAQKVAEGVELEIHRNTWRYTRLIEQQRDIIMEHRDRILHTDVADKLFVKHAPDRHKELVDQYGEELVANAARQILLYHLDRRWVDHLGFTADVRETVHLRALAKETPIDEFHRAVVPAFNQIVPEAHETAEASFDTVKISEKGAELEEAGLKRPTSTWTYMVYDNPFDSDAEQALKKVRAQVKKIRAER